MYHGLKERGLSDIGQSPSARGGECLFFGSFLSIVLGESPQRTRSQDWPWHSAILFPHGECRWPVGAEGHAEASYTSKILSLLASHCEKSGGWCLIFHCRDQVLLLGAWRRAEEIWEGIPCLCLVSPRVWNTSWTAVYFHMRCLTHQEEYRWGRNPVHVGFTTWQRCTKMHSLPTPPKVGSWEVRLFFHCFVSKAWWKS